MTTANQRVMIVDAESSIEANVDDSGYLEVSVKAGGAGGTSMADDAAFTVGTTSVTPIAGVYTTDQINSGDAGAVLIDADRHLQVDVLSGGGTGGTQYADGAARGTATGTIAMGDDGTLIQSLKCDVNGALAVQDNGGSLTVDGIFWQTTQPISGTVTADTEAKALRQLVEYSAGNPVYVGEAAPGTLASASSWRIKKITYTSGDPTDISWADGVGTFTKVWNSRASYDYTPDA